MSTGSADHRHTDEDKELHTVVDFIDHPDALETLTLAEIRAEFARRGFEENTRGSHALNWSWKKEHNGDPTSALILTRDKRIVHLCLASKGAYAINEIVEHADAISEQQAIVLFTHLRFGATHLSDATRAFLAQLYRQYGIHVRLKSTRKMLERLLNPSDE